MADALAEAVIQGDMLAETALLREALTEPAALTLGDTDAVVEGLRDELHRTRGLPSVDSAAACASEAAKLKTRMEAIAPVYGTTFATFW